MRAEAVPDVALELDGTPFVFIQNDEGVLLIADNSTIHHDDFDVAEHRHQGVVHI